MKTPANTMARTDDNPVLKLAQCILTKLKPLFDWSNGEVRLVFHGDGGRGSRGGRCEELGDLLLQSVTVNEVVSVAEQ